MASNVHQPDGGEMTNLKSSFSREDLIYIHRRLIYGHGGDLLVIGLKCSVCAAWRAASLDGLIGYSRIRADTLSNMTDAFRSMVAALAAAEPKQAQAASAGGLALRNRGERDGT